MLSGTQIVFVVLSLVFVLVNLIAIVYEIRSELALARKNAISNTHTGTTDAGQDALYLSGVNRTSSGWDFGADICGGCDGAGF